MRLSTRPHDPGFGTYRALPRSVMAKVTLNGEEVRNVATADARTGYVLVAKTDAQGRLQMNARKDGVLLQQLRGRVGIELVRRA